MGKERKTAHVVVVANRKGGCGKTQTSVNLAAGLACNGKRVLCIDADSQGSLSVSLGVKEPDKLETTLTTAMTHIINEQDYDPLAGILHHTEGIDFLPANSNLAAIEISLAGIIGRETVLRRHIDKMKSFYDYIILDTAPTLDLLTINALAAADSVIIPVCPKYLDAKGLELLLKSIAQIRRQINPTLEIGGVLFTLTLSLRESGHSGQSAKGRPSGVDRRARFTREVMESVTGAYGDKINIFTEYIPRSVRAAECAAQGVSIFQYDPHSTVAAAYASLVGKVLAHG